MALTDPGVIILEEWVDPNDITEIKKNTITIIYTLLIGHLSSEMYIMSIQQICHYSPAEG